MISTGATDTAVRVPLCDRGATVEELYAAMFAIRTFEQSLLDMFDRGALVGTTHTSLGQEATAVGVCAAMDRERDVVFSNHRGHGHFLAYCGEAERLYLEIMGKPGGLCAGRGGSQHVHYHNFYSNGVLGGTVPVAVGAALAEKQKASGAITVVFLGDGAMGEGVVYEAFNIASLWQLPVLFVLEDNGIAQSTPGRLQIAGDLKARPEAFGIPVQQCATTDVRRVMSLAREQVDAVRLESRPCCLLIQNYRLGPHSKGDDHRDPDEIEAAWQSEPLKTLGPALDTNEVDHIEAAMAGLVHEAMERALAAPAYGI